MRMEEHRNRNTDVNEYRNTWKQMEPGGPTHLGSRHGILITVIGNKLLWLLWIKLYHTPPHLLTDIFSTYHYFRCLFIRCYICYILPVKGRRKQYDCMFYSQIRPCIKDPVDWSINTVSVMSIMVPELGRTPCLRVVSCKL